MFKQLAGLLANNIAVTLLMTGSAEAMTVTVIPKPAKAGQGQEGLSVPLVLNGTAEELDIGFAELVVNFTNKRQSLAEQYEATASVLEAAKKSSATNAAKGIAKTAKAAAAQPEATGDDDDDENSSDNDSNNVVTQGSAAAPTVNLFG